MQKDAQGRALSVTALSLMLLLLQEGKQRKDQDEAQHAATGISAKHIDGQMFGSRNTWRVNQNLPGDAHFWTLWTTLEKFENKILLHM